MNGIGEENSRLALVSEPVGSGPVWVLSQGEAAAAVPVPAAGSNESAGLAPGPMAGVILTPERRRELRAAYYRGELDSLTIRAVTFRAAYPNANYLRFRETDLAGFAGSYVGVPFLRDHNTWEIGARGGTVRGSELDGDAFLQTIELTVPRDIEAFLNGQIDRFSIGWYWSGITCSVCSGDWLNVSCPHWPGRKYRQRGEDGQEREVLCELIFEGPTGKEVSAVNAPAVQATGVRAVLGALRALRAKQAKRAATMAATGRSPARSAVDGEAARDALAHGEGGKMAEGVLAPNVEGLENGGVAVEHGAGQAVTPDSLAEARELMEAQRQAVLEARLAASDLPAELREVVRGGLPRRWTVAELDQAIDRAVAAWAKLEEQRTVQGMAPRPGQGRVTGMLTGTDQLQLALDGLLASRRPEKGVRPLSGIREFYALLSGDYEMRGMFCPESVGLAAVDSSTMAGMVANAMNKVIVNTFQAFPRWWEPIVTIEDFETLQQVRWVTVGGVGELPTVNEGAGYSEMIWSDQTETTDWVKKGGYLGLTLEAIDKDDTRRIQQAGPALARAAWLSLGKSISSIFTSASGAGPSMSDGNALFHALHSNLGSTALSYSAYTATRLAMRKQTELNSGERLGGLVVPRYLLVPPDLEATAVQIMASELEPGQANFSENVYSQGNTHEARLAAARNRVVVVDFWSDSNNWAVAADPLLYPSIGLGFRFGHQPEVFSVASPNSGLLFTNDVLPVKVRFFFAVGPTDWRGLYKHNVTGA